MRKIIYNNGDLIGECIYICDVKPFYRRAAKFQCKCGNEFITTIDKVRIGETASCGCAKYRKGKECPNFKHGDTLSKEYRTWCNIKRRCLDSNHEKYSYYGGRGIAVCKEWVDSFKTFLDDMGRSPSSKHSIDRINSNGNYCKSNCRWATKYEQSRNKNTTLHLTYMNETKPLVEWAEKFNIPYNTLRRRMRSNWSIDDAVIKDFYKKQNK